jgi:ankyrin repeat protein
LTLKSLLEWEVDINARDAGHQTPLAGAATMGNLDAVRLLIERGGYM